MKEIFIILAQLKPEQITIPKAPLGESNIAGALKLVFGVSGAIAVLIITLAGFKYVVSMGNPEQAARAKNAIIYALIGLLVCLVAYNAVNFVLDRL